MKKLHLTFALGAALLMFSSTALAINIDGGDPDPVKGKEAFGKCRECHNGDKAKSLSPSHKTKKQWTRYFDGDLKKLKRKMPDWDSFGYSDEYLETVHRYLVNHALDSDKPQTCD